MLASHAGDDLIPKPASCTLQLFDRCGKVSDLDLDSIPTAGSRELTIWHCLSSPARTRPVEQQSEISVRQAGEAGRWMHVDAETQLVRVKGDGRVNIVNDVSD